MAVGSIHGSLITAQHQQVGPDHRQEQSKWTRSRKRDQCSENVGDNPNADDPPHTNAFPRDQHLSKIQNHVTPSLTQSLPFAQPSSARQSPHWPSPPPGRPSCLSVGVHILLFLPNLQTFNHRKWAATSLVRVNRTPQSDWTTRLSSRRSTGRHSLQRDMRKMKWRRVC